MPFKYNILIIIAFILADSVVTQVSNAEDVIEQDASLRLDQTTFKNYFVSGGIQKIPTHIPQPSDDGKIYVTDDLAGTKRALTIDASLQKHMEMFIEQNNSPIASVMIVDARSGKVLAMAQGRDPDIWNGTSKNANQPVDMHTSIFPGFPAASLFKTVVAIAGVEIVNLAPDFSLSFSGGCQDVAKNGMWILDDYYRYARIVTLSEAFGDSCNTFFAKLAVNVVGLSAIDEYTRKLGWGESITADFWVPQSPRRTPTVSDTSLDAVGKFAAGFGDVGVSVAHMSWIYLAIANEGKALPLIIFEDTEKNLLNKIDHIFYPKMFSEKTAKTLQTLMSSTVREGTARATFRNPKYRGLMDKAGGKTGTLKVRFPAGIGTWFAGLMPYDNPEVVVVSFVLLEDRWMFRSSQLAAEALNAYQESSQRIRNNNLAVILP